jgi:hypothetical protein
MEVQVKKFMIQRPTKSLTSWTYGGATALMPLSNLQNTFGERTHRPE